MWLPTFYKTISAINIVLSTCLQICIFFHIEWLVGEVTMSVILRKIQFPKILEQASEELHHILLWYWTNWMFITKISWFIIFWLQVHSSGYFEIQLLSIQNERGELFSGECCDGTRSMAGDTCTDPCDTFFTVCLKEYQSRATAEGQCTFGKNHTGVLGQNSYSIDILGDSTEAELDEVARATMRFPFNFGWVVSFFKISRFIVKEQVKMHSSEFQRIYQATLVFNACVKSCTAFTRSICQS